MPRGTLRVACVTSVFVWFRNKEQGTKVKDRAKNGAVKERGGGGVGKKGGKIPFPLPPLSFIFWLSFHFSRGQNRKSRSSSFFAPKPNGNACYAGYVKGTFGRFIRLITRGPFLERPKNFSGQRQILESKPVSQFLAHKRVNFASVVN